MRLSAGIVLLLFLAACKARGPQSALREADAADVPLSELVQRLSDDASACAVLTGFVDPDAAPTPDALALTAKPAAPVQAGTSDKKAGALIAALDYFGTQSDIRSDQKTIFRVLRNDLALIKMHLSRATADELAAIDPKLDALVFLLTQYVEKTTREANTDATGMVASIAQMHAELRKVASPALNSALECRIIPGSDTGTSGNMWNYAPFRKDGTMIGKAQYLSAHQQNRCMTQYDCELTTSARNDQLDVICSCIGNMLYQVPYDVRANKVVGKVYDLRRDDDGKIYYCERGSDRWRLLPP